jgi:hypothetical protein
MASNVSARESPHTCSLAQVFVDSGFLKGKNWGVISPGFFRPTAGRHLTRIARIGHHLAYASLGVGGLSL